MKSVSDACLATLVGAALKTLVDNGASAEVVGSFALEFPAKVTTVLRQSGDANPEDTRDLAEIILLTVTQTLQAIAIRLYEDQAITLGSAARLARLPQEAFMQVLGDLKIPVIRYSADELQAEVSAVLH